MRDFFRQPTVLLVAGIHAFLLLLLVVAAAARGGSASSPQSAPGLFPPDELPHGATYLAGLVICIDPGHGGDIGEHYDRQQYKRGPSGVREAVVNMRVSEKLAALLTAAGATPLLTRTEDIDVPLATRVAMANDACADLFLSVHHNTSTRESANFSSVWYHRDGSDRPASLDLARYLNDALVRWLQPTEPQFSGVYSDTLMYENGFHVLRETRMPAVLLESSFLTNIAEEARLADPAYNDLEAWAIFAGLCEWAANGIPRVQPVSLPPPGQPGTHEYRLLDGMKEKWGSGSPRLRSGSIRVTLAGEPIAHQLVGDRLTFELQSLPAPPAILSIDFENRAKNSSISPPIDLLTYGCIQPIAAPPASP